MTHDLDLFYLQHALSLAKIRLGFCAPNPSVGAVIVKNEKIIASGYHLQAGAPHAEIAALQALKESANGATLYVTLEPCCHFGKTPPCTDALIKADVSRVVYGYRDPNPIVSGNGEVALTKAGIACEYVASPEITRFYEGYHYWQRTKKPFITAKIAISLDGKIARANGEPIAITGAELKKFTHECRKQSDAILTTVQTIIHDDPQLNVRYQNETMAKSIYILDRELRIAPTATIFKSAKTITLFHSNKITNTHFSDLGIRCVGIEEDNNGLNLSQIIQIIGEDGIHHLWVEAGGKCFTSFLRQKLLQRALIYIAPRWIGEGKPMITDNKDISFIDKAIQWKQMGNDVYCSIEFHENRHCEE